jgi:hypothetical protein
MKISPTIFNELMHPFACGSWEDPLRLATGELAANPTGICFFQDWGPYKDSKDKTVQDCKDYVDKCIRLGSECGDATFKYAFQQGSWILEKLLKGEIVLANPVPGLRLSNDGQGPLSFELHRAAFQHVWAPLLPFYREVYFLGLAVVRLYDLPGMALDRKPDIVVYTGSHPRSWSSPNVNRNPVKLVRSTIGS